MSQTILFGVVHEKTFKTLSAFITIENGKTIGYLGESVDSGCWLFDAFLRLLIIVLVKRTFKTLFSLK